MKTVHDVAIPAIIAEIISAPIAVKAPFLKVNIRAKINTSTNQIPKAKLANPTSISIAMCGINDKNENNVLIINGGVEYPIALMTWLNESASPLMAFPM